MAHRHFCLYSETIVGKSFVPPVTAYIAINGIVEKCILHNILEPYLRIDSL